MTMTIRTRGSNSIEIASGVPSLRLREIYHFCDFLCLAFLPFPFLSFPSLLFSCSPPQVKRVNRCPWLIAQTMRFHPRKCLFWVSLKNFGCKGSKTPKNPPKEGVVYGFPAKLEKQKKLITKPNEEISTPNLNCGWRSRPSHWISGQRSPITKSKMAAAAILKIEFRL